MIRSDIQAILAQKMLIGRLPVSRIISSHDFEFEEQFFNLKGNFFFQKRMFLAWKVT